MLGYSRCSSDACTNKRACIDCSPDVSTDPRPNEPLTDELLSLWRVFEAQNGTIAIPPAGTANYANSITCEYRT